jgi:predicted GH43/DUF377 family glycosyl hydrolase
MKWKKLGKIFDPTDHNLPNGCFGFAQSPQTLVFDTYVRIYFSTRARDINGKYLSHVAFVDFDKQFQNVIRVSDKTVIPLGGLGCFDEHGIFPFNVIRSNYQILAYTTGWNRRVSVPTDAAIGLAISDDDGLTFKKVGMGPVLSASLHEPFLVGDAFVKMFGDKYHMWYIHGTKWVTRTEGAMPDRIYKIAHASSVDGVNWEKEGRQIVSDKLNSEECQALPTVVQVDNRYHMFFCYREVSDFRTNRSRGYRIGYAFSDDLVKWTRDDENAGIELSESGWDSEMQCYPHVFTMDSDVYLLYNGNEFGRLGFGLAKLEK